MDATELISGAADSLTAAVRFRSPVAATRRLLGTSDINAAYAVQREMNRRRETAGAVPVGRKISHFTPAPHRNGPAEVAYGVLFADMDVSGAQVVPAHRLLQPRVQAHVAIVLEQALTSDDLNDNDPRNAVAYALAALEIADCRLSHWDMTFEDHIADNASTGLFLLSNAPLELAEFSLDAVRARLHSDGVAAEEPPAASSTDPIEALVRLVREAGALEAGQIVLSGGIGPQLVPSRGCRITADLGPLGTITAQFP